MSLASLNHGVAQGQSYATPVWNSGGGGGVNLTADVSTTAGVGVSVQLTGVIVLALIVGIVVMSAKWPVL